MTGNDGAGPLGSEGTISLQDGQLLVVQLTPQSVPLPLYYFVPLAPAMAQHGVAYAPQWPTFLQPWVLQYAPLAAATSPMISLGSVTRPDGSRQVTYKGWPLYVFQAPESLPTGVVPGLFAWAYKDMVPLSHASGEVVGSTAAGDDGDMDGGPGLDQGP